MKCILCIEQKEFLKKYITINEFSKCKIQKLILYLIFKNSKTSDSHRPLLNLTEK